MLPYLQMGSGFGNPASSSHCYGWEAKKAIDHAREAVARLIHAEVLEIIWTSGATEANNLAIKGAAQFYSEKKGRHIISMQTEHKSVLDTCDFLKKQGYRVTYLKPQPDGLLDLETVRNAIDSETVLLSVMHVNNETGVIQEIEALGKLAHARGVLFHVDAAQSGGKLNIDVNQMHIDLLSLSAHKMYGPKGVGALYARAHPKVRLIPQIHGGGHEFGLRSGTVATHQIAGFGRAAEIARAEQHLEHRRIEDLSNQLMAGLCLPGITRNGACDQRWPGIVSLTVEGIEGEALLGSLKGLALSTGSACNSVTLESSHVLRALGIPSHLAHSTLRLSFGRFTTQNDIVAAGHELSRVIEHLRGIAPMGVYEAAK
jgi:cysteine desulfurase